MRSTNKNKSTAAAVLFCAFYALPFRKEASKTAQGRHSNPSVRFLPIVDTQYA